MNREAPQPYLQKVRGLTFVQLKAEAKANSIKHDLSSLIILGGIIGEIGAIALASTNVIDPAMGLLLSSVGVLLSLAGVSYGLRYGNRSIDLGKVAKERKISLPRSITERGINRLYPT